MVKRDVYARFWNKVRLSDSEAGCWLWIGAKNREGYGLFGARGRMMSVHRLAYIWEHGPIEEGLQIDHLCRQRNCVKVDHLEVVTQEENLMRRHMHRGPRLKTQIQTPLPKGYHGDAYEGQLSIKDIQAHKRAMGE